MGTIEIERSGENLLSFYDDPEGRKVTLQVADTAMTESVLSTHISRR